MRIESKWQLSNRADKRALELADRHYNRQKPGTKQFVPPGRCIVLWQPGALWVTSWPYAQFVKHAWAGAWINSLFRREFGELKASDMIREAISITRYLWPNIPDLGMISFVDASKIRHKRDPGRCYKKAGFTMVGKTKSKKLLVYQILPEEMPKPIAIMENSR